MLAAARVGAVLGSGAPGLEARLRALYPQVGLPVDLDRWLNAAVLARVAVDKKRGRDGLSFVLVDEVGTARLLPLTVERLGEMLLDGKTR
jgi:3-dehydroquinate synthetase